MNYLIKVGSVTNAQRSVAVLHRNNIKADVKKIQNAKEGEGCGYAVLVKDEIKEALKLLKDNGISVIATEKV